MYASSRKPLRRTVSTTIRTSSSTGGRSVMSSIPALRRMRSMCSRSFSPYRTPCSSFQYARMPSKTAVPYMNAWVMMLTFASRSGDVLALEVGDQVVRRASVRRGAPAGVVAVSPSGFSVSMGGSSDVGRPRPRRSRNRGRSIPRVPVRPAVAAIGPPARSGVSPADPDPDDHEIGDVERAADEQAAAPAAGRVRAHRQEDRGARQERDPGRREGEVAARAGDPALRREDAARPRPGSPTGRPSRR